MALNIEKLCIGLNIDTKVREKCGIGLNNGTEGREMGHRVK